MHHRLQFALDEALIHAFGLMRHVRGVLAPMMTRDKRAEARRLLRLAERFFRRALILLSLEEELPPPRPPRARKDAAVPREGCQRPPRAFALTEPVPPAARPRRLMPAGLFDRVDPAAPVSAARLIARLARLNAAYADPLRCARRLALLRRRLLSRKARPFRLPPLAQPRPADAHARDMAGWLRLVDEAAREGLAAGPG